MASGRLGVVTSCRRSCRFSAMICGDLWGRVCDLLLSSAPLFTSGCRPAPLDFDMLRRHGLPEAASIRRFFWLLHISRGLGELRLSLVRSGQS